MKSAALSIITLAVALAAIGLFAVRPVEDFDTGYHFATGEYILDTHTIPTQDVFSFSAPGARWISHYWLGDTLFAVLERVGGLWAVMGFIALLAATTFALVFRIGWMRSSGPSYLLAIVALALLGLTRELWVIRPQVFSYLLLGVVLFLIEKARRHNRTALAVIPLLLWLWANMHSSVVFGIALVWLWVLTEGYRAWPNWKKAALPAVVGAVGSALTLMNPSGLGVHLLIQQVDKDIQEFHSLLSFLGSWQANLFLLLIVVAGGIAVSMWRRQWKTEKDLFWPAVAFVAALLPLQAIRHVGFFPILVLPAFAPLVLSLEEQIPTQFRLAAKRVCIFVVVLLLYFGVRSAVVVTAEPDGTVLPVAATKFLDEAEIQDPIFHTPEFGGYLIWKRWPAHLVFVDGRNDVYGETGVLEAYRAIIEQQPGWEDRFQYYGFNAVMVPYRGLYSEPVGRLSRSLVENLGFTLVYWDDVALVYVRDAAHADVVATEGYRIIDPYRNPAFFSSEELEIARREVIRAQDTTPNSMVVRRYAEAVARVVSSDEE